MSSRKCAYLQDIKSILDYQFKILIDIIQRELDANTSRLITKRIRSCKDGIIESISGSAFREGETCDE
jgi:hypothetical protein